MKFKICFFSNYSDDDLLKVSISTPKSLELDNSPHDKIFRSNTESTPKEECKKISKEPKTLNYSF